MRIIKLLPVLLLLLCGIFNSFSQESTRNTDYTTLVTLFQQWREFENPPLLEGAPDYTAAGRKGRWPEFKKLQAALEAIDTTGWATPQKVDWTIVWAEMNGYDFNERVLRSWERDPAFYKSVWMERSDVPAHEGPTHHRTTEVWTYEFPLSPTGRERFLKDLRVIPALNTQARKNLTGNARELWIAGIRDIRQQSEDLKGLLNLPGVGSDPEVSKAIDNAIRSTDSFVQWLEGQAPAKTGPSGIGRENYTWYLQNVHLVPLTWADEVMLLKRELARAWSALKLEEHRNRNLPELTDADSPEAYNTMADKAAKSLIGFLETEDIVTVKPYFDPALQGTPRRIYPKRKTKFLHHRGALRSPPPVFPFLPLVRTRPYGY